MWHAATPPVRVAIGASDSRLAFATQRSASRKPDGRTDGTIFARRAAVSEFSLIYMIMWAWSLTGMIFGIMWASMLVDYLGYGRVRRAAAARGCCCAPPPSPRPPATTTAAPPRRQRNDTESVAPRPARQVHARVGRRAARAVLDLSRRDAGRSVRERPGRAIRGGAARPQQNKHDALSHPGIRRARLAQPLAPPPRGSHDPVAPNVRRRRRRSPRRCPPSRARRSRWRRSATRSRRR